MECILTASFELDAPFLSRENLQIKQQRTCKLTQDQQIYVLKFYSKQFKMNSLPLQIFVFLPSSYRSH